MALQSNADLRLLKDLHLLKALRILKGPLYFDFSFQFLICTHFVFTQFHHLFFGHLSRLP